MFFYCFNLNIILNVLFINLLINKLFFILINFSKCLIFVLFPKYSFN